MKRKPEELPRDSKKRRESPPSILDPLVAAGLVRIGGKHVNRRANKISGQEPYSETELVKNHPLSDNPGYQDFVRNHQNFREMQTYEDRLKKQDKGDEKYQLADFVIKNLAKNNPQWGGNLDSLDLITTPYKLKGARSDFYGGGLGPEYDEQRIILSPYDAVTNPITALMHEGTHALDDFTMRTYQKEAIDSLAKIEGENHIGPDEEGVKKLQDLLLSARNIIGHPEYTDNLYPFKDDQENILKGFNRLNETEEGMLPIKTFQEAQTALNTIRKRPAEEGEEGFQVPESDIFQEFSEFPAFAMEKLFDPWTINEQTNPQSMEFLRNIMTGVRQNFKQMGGGKESFSQSYPMVYNAFQEKKRALNPDTQNINNRTNRLISGPPSPAGFDPQSNNPINRMISGPPSPTGFDSQTNNPINQRIQPQQDNYGGYDSRYDPKSNNTTTTTTIPQLMYPQQYSPHYPNPENNNTTTTTTIPQ